MLKKINPLQSRLPDLAVIERVVSEENRLSDSEHETAAKAFLLSDSIAYGIARDFAFVKKIPQYIKQIIDNKSWECLYVAKGVVNPYYCRYIKGTDSDNFRAFIEAKRPNGLETNVSEIDNLLILDRDVQKLFRQTVDMKETSLETTLNSFESFKSNFFLLTTKNQEVLKEFILALISSNSD